MSREPVYVVTTTRHRTLFGLHRPCGVSRDDASNTYVLGFKASLHAEALAKSLQTYKARHGTFPRREVPVHDMNLPPGVNADIELKDVHVHMVELDDLMDRLRGTDIRVSVLTHVDESEGLRFKWKDVHPDQGARAVTDMLKSAYDRSPSLAPAANVTVSTRVQTTDASVQMIVKITERLWNRWLLFVAGLEIAVMMGILRNLL